MTRNELLRAIKDIPALALAINEAEGKNFTNCKTEVLMKHWDAYHAPAPVADNDAFESAAISFLVTLEQKGVLDGLLTKIRG